MSENPDTHFNSLIAPFIDNLGKETTLMTDWHLSLENKPMTHAERELYKSTGSSLAGMRYVHTTHKNKIVRMQARK